MMSRLLGPLSDSVSNMSLRLCAAAERIDGAASAAALAVAFRKSRRLMLIVLRHPRSSCPPARRSNARANRREPRPGRPGRYGQAAQAVARGELRQVSGG